MPARPHGSGARSSRDLDRRFLTGVARAFAGAIIFALPMLMTMEMWQIGFYIDPWRVLKVEHSASFPRRPG